MLLHWLLVNIISKMIYLSFKNVVNRGYVSLYITYLFSSGFLKYFSFISILEEFDYHVFSCSFPHFSFLWFGWVFSIYRFIVFLLSSLFSFSFGTLITYISDCLKMYHSSLMPNIFFSEIFLTVLKRYFYLSCILAH